MTVESLFPRPRSYARRAGTTPVAAPVSEVREPRLAAEHYRLHVGDGRVALHFADDAGRRYGLQTLAQLRAGAVALEIENVEIDDGPDFATRGYMLDISRDRVPTNETLGWLVERLAALRYNHLQLYTEHTFAYAGHEAVWRDASPITPDDIAWLQARCAEHGIELAANQNTFGHMERWLAHEPYRAQAETPDGFMRGRRRRAPSALAPTPENAEFALGLVRELLGCFTSRRVNIGCDEVWELGKGASASEVAARGKPAVFVEHLRRLAEPLLADGYEVQFWADMVQRAPDAARSLADAGAIAAVWGYEKPLGVDPADVDFDAMPDDIREVAREYLETAGRGFGPRLASFAETGFRTWVVPGTSGWNTLVGRHSNARGNLLDAVESGLAHGVEGVLVTEWGDNGHMQPPFATLPALAYGGATTWCRASNGDLDDDALGSAVSRLVEDESQRFGPALIRLGGVADALALPQLNGTAFFYKLVASGLPVASGAPSAESYARAVASLEAGVADVEASRPGAGDGQLLVRETLQAAGLARHALRDLGAEHGLEASDDAALLAELSARLEEQRACWLARSRPGGLDDSVRRCKRARFG